MTNGSLLSTWMPMVAVSPTATSVDSAVNSVNITVGFTPTMWGWAARPSGVTVEAPKPGDPVFTLRKESQKYSGLLARLREGQDEPPGIVEGHG